MSQYGSHPAPAPGYPAPPGYSTGPVAPQGRPGTLNAAVWISLVVGVFGILAGVLDIAAGKSSIQKGTNKIAGDLGVDADTVNQVAGSALNDAYHALVLKAVVGIVISVLVIAFALAARNAALWARVTLTVALVAGMCGSSGLQVAERAFPPSASFILVAVTPLLSLVAIILLYLPATNRYAAARKTA